MSVELLFPNPPKHWRVTTLGELAKDSGGDIQTGPFGSQLHASDYVEDGIPSIMPKNISIDSILTDDISRVSPSDLERLSKYKVRIGDIVYSRRGDVEKCARITSAEDGWLCGTGCLRVRVLPREVSVEYLHAYLCHPAVREWILRHAVGATMPNLNTSILSSLPVLIPSKDEMRFISSLWLSFSQKIQLNHQINQTLEQIAQALFKSWFVDFEPVKAKIAARERWQALHQPESESASPVCYAAEFDEPPAVGDLESYMNRAAMQAIAGKTADQLDALRAEDPEWYQELYETSALFPSAMQESELGEIPAGWECSTIGAEVEIKGGGTPPTKNKEYWEGGDVSWTSPKDLSGAQSKVMISTEKNITEAGLAKISSGLLPVDTVLMSSRAPVGYLALTKIPVAINQGYIAMVCKKRLQPEYVLQWAESVMDDIKQLASGSTFAEISKKSFRGIPIVVPVDSLVSVFSNIARAKYSSIELNLKSSNNLSEIRDTLLPKLLSGELEV